MARATQRLSVHLEVAPMTDLVPVDMESAALVSLISYNFSAISKFFIPVFAKKNISVTLTCGGTSSENCTYFDSSSPVAGGCSVTICPCNNNICQVSKLIFD